ncbi:hypothetical protein WR25_19717 [Diploscapter pachys]|uniref:Uncharacterized protein n=1 Tax=Diploscapter pachys TaxID=2018661 RepID=A0A2A2L3G7_9BILA|nr:hypothetical protein WR25_19717 [Diploscapter pachys]
MPSVEAFGLSMEQAQQKMTEFTQQGISFVYRAKDRYEELFESVEGDLTPPRSAGIALREQGSGCNGMQNVSKMPKQKSEKKVADDSGQSSMEHSADIFTHLEEPDQIHNQAPQTQLQPQSQQRTQLASTYPFPIINQTSAAAPAQQTQSQTGFGYPQSNVNQEQTNTASEQQKMAQAPTQFGQTQHRQSMNQFSAFAQQPTSNVATSADFSQQNHSTDFSSGSAISASGTDLIDSAPVPNLSQPVQHPPSQSAPDSTSDVAPTTPVKPKAPVDPSKFAQKWKPAKIAIPSPEELGIVPGMSSGRGFGNQQRGQGGFQQQRGNTGYNSVSAGGGGVAFKGRGPKFYNPRRD